MLVYIHSCRNRPSFPIVYTTQGTIVAASYAGVCSECKAIIHHSSWMNQTEDERKEFFFDPSHSQYIQCTSQSVFERKLLDEITHQIVHAGATFESQAIVYNAVNGESDEVRLATYVDCFRRVRNLHSLSWKLNETRLEDGWFLYQLVCYHLETGCLSTQDLCTETVKGTRRDIEGLCEVANHMRSLDSPKWVQHRCSTIGCTEGFAVIDGNEKINRSICAAPKSKVSLPHQYIYMTSMCTRSPTTGGKHLKPSKYCEHHMEELSSSDSLPTPHSTNSLLEKSVIGDVPENDDSNLLVGCRKAKGVTRFYDRTAGVLSLVRPCGVIVNTSEMYTCESPTQVYLFLVMTFARGNDIDRLHYLGYDRACDLHPFICNLETKGAFFARWLNRRVKFLVDHFHVAKHTEPCCMPPDNPMCKYHPSLPQFSDIQGVNTECAEQSFRWLNKLKHSLKHMKQHRFNFFLYIIINHRNIHVERGLRERKLM